MMNSFKKVIYVLLPIMAYYVVHDLTRLLMMFLLQFASTGSTAVYDFVRGNDAFLSGIISVIDILVGVAVLLFIMRTDKEELSIWDYLNVNGLSFYRTDRIHAPAFSWILLSLQAVSMALGINILIRLSGIVEHSAYGETTYTQYMIPMWLGLLLYGVISPVAEELLFRLIVFGRLKRRFNIYIAILMTSLFFGLYHGNIVQGIYGFIMGALMCIAVEYVHSVYGSLLIHSLANITIYILGLKGVLGEVGGIGTGLALVSFGLVTLFFELYYSHRTVAEYGDIYGVTYVGGFFTDDYESDDDDAQENM
ncbi:MAG: CPBP family intramembrane metalloprotease [Lachnospiraceae bacterium]|nr:CPBP family intramembrane metalloprotease [Lachnospiraceae bacterium]